jgi:hypothetical protein
MERFVGAESGCGGAHGHGALGRRSTGERAQSSRQQAGEDGATYHCYPYPRAQFQEISTPA